jgi:RNase P/RNase MRP subunit POP5
MKEIPPAIQGKHRYLEFKVNGESKDLGEVVDAIWSCALKYMGTSGVSRADFRIIGNKFEEEEQRGVIKVEKVKEDDLRAALCLNSGFEDDMFLSIERTSGTLSGLE